MNEIEFNFEEIKNTTEFYKTAVEKFPLPDYFGNNLDALWDCVTAEVELPAKVTFINLTVEQLEKFKKIIELFEDAENELGEENLSFEYYLKDEYENLSEDYIEI